MNSLREEIKKILMCDMSEQDADKVVEIFLSLFLKAIEEAKPKTIDHKLLTNEGSGNVYELGRTDGVSDYHDKLMERIG